MSVEPSLFPNANAKLRKAIAREHKEEPREWAAIPVGSILLAIDPSMAHCGWAIMEKTGKDPLRINSGTIHPAAEEGKSPFEVLAAKVSALCHPGEGVRGRTYEVTDIALEIPRGGGVGGKRISLYNQAVGVCRAACFLSGLPVNCVPVHTWKGKEDKEWAFRHARAIFHYQPTNDNEADALCLGAWLCGQRQSIKP